MRNSVVLSNFTIQCLILCHLAGPQATQMFGETLFGVCFIYLFVFLAVLCLHCCAQAFSSCGKRGCSLVAVYELLNEVASSVEEHWPYGVQTSVAVALRL